MKKATWLKVWKSWLVNSANILIINGIYIAFSIFVFFVLVLYTTIVIYSFTRIVTQASQLHTTL